MPPPRKVRIDNVVDRLSSSSSRKKRSRDILSPRTFLIGIVFAASLLLALSVYLTNQLDGQSPPVASSNAAAKGGAKAVISSSNGDDNIRSVICNELMNDSTIWDPNKDSDKDKMKRLTKTDPQFWIALHHPSFDNMRWVSIKLTGEYYEKGVTSIFHQILSTYDLTNKEENKQPPLVIDIGMNIGWFSLYSRAHGHDVAAFEPNPVMFLRMCESLEYNKWGSDNDYDSGSNSVSLWKYGLGIAKGSFNLTTGNNPGGSSFFEDRLAKKFRRTIPVDVTTLDTVALEQGWLDRTVSLMKVDVEGFEPYVFEGGKRLLREGRVENLFMESSVSDIAKVGEMVDLLYSAGFRMKGIYSVNGDPYHEDWWHTFNPVFEQIHGGSMESSDQMEFLAKVTCNIWW
eukprot:CAMPEP_0201709174 /NCGR_PEP_ID=MMETSP0578-20130828/57958_1 /ASSEMBLY_ACC=CAM_ASM_000663 /TAXON_ID=267565 /ORGANISM="Skeletonema grethea, Strain CCMP 1804" /LENGTH=399 /DNA_ID=CAMNT_0048198127 /DNA_START=94 /DNA_END=1290 /DNA_ORIENTATION=-